MSVAGLIVAGGSSKRFVSSTPKQFHVIDNDVVINHSIKKFLNNKKISKLIIAIQKKTYKKYSRLILKHKKIIIVNGGQTRALSVLNGLKKAKKLKINKILIHDAARPFFSSDLINLEIKYLKKFDAVIPCVPSTDTLVSSNQIISREKVKNIQTPQGFDFKKILKLHLLNKNKNVSDDSTLFFNNKINVKIIKGNIFNKKITFIDDLKNIRDKLYGIGYDIHEMIPGRKLFVGGIYIPSKMGPIGHSDGDSLLHALIDSLLGAAKKGDIGTLFPNSLKFKNIRSTKLLTTTIKILKQNKLEIDSIDLNIILQSPNLTKYKAKIQNNLAKICGIDKTKINIKAKTTDRLGIIGKNKALACEVISVLKYEH